MSDSIKTLLRFVYNHLVKEANNSLISEYAKRESSWKKLKEIPYSINLIDSLKNYLILEEEKIQREKEKELDTTTIENSIYLVSEIYSMGLKFWDGFKIYIDKNKPDGFDYYSVFDLFSKLNNKTNLDQKDISFGKRVLDFTQETPLLIDEIKALSNLEENLMIEIKFIYDRLLLISKDKWKNIIDLASRNNIFDNLALDNIKSVQASLSKKEIMKEQALIKCYESLQKLKKFQIEI